MIPAYGSARYLSEPGISAFDNPDASYNAPKVSSYATPVQTAQPVSALQALTSTLSQPVQTVAPAPTAPNGSVDWAAYVRGNPDAYANWMAIQNTSSGMPFHGDIVQFGQYHYAQDGSRRDLSPFTIGGTAPATTATPTTSTTTPDVTVPTANGISDGASRMNTTPSMTDIIRSTPGYEFQYKEGLRGINENAYMRGLGNSGATAKALDNYARNMADSYYQTYLGNVTGVAEQGRGAASAIAGDANTMGAGVTGAMNNAATAYQNQANAAANNAYTRANATNSMVQSISNTMGNIGGSIIGRY
ncbi:MULTISPECIES: hypothetical protein [Sphingomonas]|uniref:hypothetical protein n=1 Tax=Sphingomonas TaxID=13687 RepID=UPI000DEECA60|nr:MULTISPECIES: hypothetical protein [Sphingomonas]